MHMLNENYQPEVNFAALEAGAAHRQRRQMRLALMLLLTALALVLVKDRQFWFGPLLTAGSEAADQTASDSQSPRHVTPAKSKRAKSKHAGATVLASDAQATVSGEVTQRAVLPPLAVEVIYGGGQRRTLQARDSSINLDLQHSSYVAPAPAGGGDPGPETGPTNAAERVRLSPETVEAVARPVEPKYPLLAKQMNVQGSVALRARIDKDGSIQDLQVLSGPDILSAAAQQAVRQWRFRPYYKAGQAVETEAHITVNFTITTR